MNPAEQSSISFSVEEDAEIIEVKTMDPGGDLLLATHLLTSFGKHDDAQSSLQSGWKAARSCHSVLRGDRSKRMAELTSWSSLVIGKQTRVELRVCGGNGSAFVQCGAAESDSLWGGATIHLAAA